MQRPASKPCAACSSHAGGTTLLKRNIQAQIALIPRLLAADGRVTARRSGEIRMPQRARAARDPDEWLPSWERRQHEIWRE